MDLQNAFLEINWWSVIVSALAAFAIGGLWYSPLLFGNIWQKLIGLKQEDLKETSMPLIFGSTFILNIIGALVLDMFIGPDATLIIGLAAGLLVGLAWVTTSIAINYLFARRPFRLFLIDAGYFSVFFAVMGIILGSW